MRTTLPNGKLYGALLDTMPEWQAAYELRPPTPREEAVGRLAAWLDRMPASPNSCGTRNVT